MSDEGNCSGYQECSFTVENLDIDEPIAEARRQLRFSADCSRPVWSKSNTDRCVWHSEQENKPISKLENTVGAGDLAGAIAHTNLQSIDFPPNLTFLGADLCGSNLSECMLSNRNPNAIGSNQMTSVDFRYADLRDVDFSHSNLAGIWFTGADLRKADFFNAELPNADLHGADLRHADFLSANLANTILDDADLRKARFLNTNLSDLSLNQRTKIKGIIRGLCTKAKDSYQWNGLAQGYHDLKEQFSENGLSSQAQDAFTLERRARAREALVMGSFGKLRFLSSLFSRYITGFGTQPLLVLVWSALLAGVSAFIYAMAGEPTPLYYSLVTFTTAPPHPPSEFAGPELTRVRGVAMTETYLGTVLTVLLGYVLGNRARF